MNISKPVSALLSFIFVLALNSCKEKKENTPATSRQGGGPQVLSLEGLIASSKTINAQIEVPGTILASESTEIHPEVSGRVVQLNIKEGAFVSQGALLAKLYDEDLQAQLRKLDVQLKIADQTEKRQSQLLKIQGISQQDYDLSLLQVHNLNADMDIVKTTIRKTEIRAPFSGKLGLRNISPGAYVTPTTIATTISQVSQLKLQFSIPEKYGAQLRNGQNIDFTIDGVQKKFSANIIATEGGIEENTRSLAVRALIKNKDGSLLPGAFAKVKLALEKSEDAIMIPNSSVLPQGRSKFVFLYKGGKAKQMEITTGVRDSTNIQVMSGISKGDTVITTGLLYLRPDVDVKLSKLAQ
ncbi:MAG: efflux RND transporter periplasmic adaptor subunit [Chitinophagaceae bacterium]